MCNHGDKCQFAHNVPDMAPENSAATDIAELTAAPAAQTEPTPKKVKFSDNIATETEITEQSRELDISNENSNQETDKVNSLGRQESEIPTKLKSMTSLLCLMGC